MAAIYPRILTLTTDFGADGPYVAAMKGVVLGLAPGTTFVDISHSIPPQDVRQGGFVLASVVPYFPPGTVHLAVVDPGVGTARRLIAVKFSDHWFVLPDNGLIGAVLDGREPSMVLSIENPQLRRATVSFTFHGRDILAPAAAHLLNGGDPAELGPSVGFVLETGDRAAIEHADGIDGEVIFVDSFGNLVTNIQLGDRDRVGAIEILGHSILGLKTTYGESSPGSLVALVGSLDRVEVAVVDGNAADRLGAVRGTPVSLRRKGAL